MKEPVRMGLPHNIAPIFLWLKESFPSHLLLSPSGCQDLVATLLGCPPAHCKVPRSTLRLPVANSVADDADLEPGLSHSVLCGLLRLRGRHVSRWR